MATSFRVATYGGGLAGAILLNGIFNCQQLDCQAFTADASFNEAPATATTGLVRNALNALELLGPRTWQCFQRAQPTPMRGVRFMLAQGDQGSFIAEEKSPADGTPTLSIVHAAPLIKELLAHIPREHLHPSKALGKIERKDQNGPITLHFNDGTTHECDILIGVDGMNSTVRRFVLGNDDPSAVPRNTGAWAIMVQTNGAEGKELFGDDAQDNLESGWLGEGAFFEPTFFNLHGKEILNVILASYDIGIELPDDRRRVVRTDELKELFVTWPERIKTAVSKLLCDQPEQPAMYLFEHPPARTYVSGSVCVIGDAAHAAVPWQGPSNGMMVEDVVILSGLLSRASSRAEAIAALEVYDEVRRPRTQKIVDSSRETGLVLTGRGHDTGLDLGKLQEKLLPRWDFIVNFDIKEHLNEAVRKFDSKLRTD